VFYKLNVENWKLCQLLLGRDIRHKFPTLHLQLAEREGAAVKPARAEAAGDAAAKKRVYELFLPLCVPTACDRGLAGGDRPRAKRGGTP